MSRNSTGSGSGKKATQKTGQRLKVSSDRLGEAGNRTCDPWFTRHRFIPYTTAAGFYHSESFSANKRLNGIKINEKNIKCNYFKLRKKAKIRNQYNQITHPTQGFQFCFCFSFPERLLTFILTSLVIRDWDKMKSILHTRNCS